MNKHTPGPWTLEPSPKGGFNVLDPDKNVPGICRTYARFGEPEDTANARLIAAAPDLLKALKDAVRLGQIRYHYRLKSNAAYCDRVDAIQAAIAKAEGEK